MTRRSTSCSCSPNCSEPTATAETHSFFAVVFSAAYIAARIIEVGITEPIPRDAAIYLLGGGEDAPQFTALDALRDSGALHAAVDGGAVVLAVCAGFQLLGTALARSDGTAVPGLGMVDAVTTRAPTRLVGEVAVHDDTCGTGWLVGFENHRGVTSLGPGELAIGPRQPTATCATDGVIHGRVVGTLPPRPGPRAQPAFRRPSTRMGRRATRPVGRSASRPAPRGACRRRRSAPRAWPAAATPASVDGSTATTTSLDRHVRPTRSGDRRSTDARSSPLTRLPDSLDFKNGNHAYFTRLCWADVAGPP